MSSSGIPSLRLHRPSGQAVATIGGRDFYFGPWGQSPRRPSAAAKAAYDLEISRWLSEGRPVAWSAADQSGITIAELMLAYVQYSEGRYRRNDGSPTGHTENVKLALRPLKRLYAERPANEFNCLMLRACAVEAIADSIRRREKPLARRVANQRARLIRRMFRWGAGRKLVDKGVPEELANFEWIYAGEILEIDGKNVMAQDPAPSQLLSATDVEKTVAFLPPVVRSLVETIRLTGARPSEIFSMRTADVDRSGQPWTYRPRWHKNFRRGLTREIQFGPQCQASLAPWLLPDSPDEFVFSPKRTVELMRQSARAERIAKRPESSGNRKKAAKRPKRVAGNRYNRTSLLHAIKRAADKAGVPPWSPGQLRHLRATELEAQFGVATAAAVLGHARVDTTLDFYVKTDSEKAKAAMSTIG